VRSLLVVEPFRFAESTTPFSFDRSPSGQFRQGLARVDTRSQRVVGGIRFSEERTDLLEVWVARMHDADPVRAHRSLVRDMSSIRAVVVRDGHQNGGDYAVSDDGAAHELRTQEGWAYSVLRVTLPVNYDMEL
jgi:hypothetical protein